MSSFVSFTIFGLVSGAAYAIALIAHREDLAPAGNNPNLTACRVCKP